MTTAVELEATPRASIDTIVCERPSSSKDDSSPAEQEIQYEITAPPAANGTQNQSTLPITRDLRPSDIAQGQDVEWEHIRAQLGLVDAEEGRIDWDNFRNQIGLAEDYKNLLKQIGQALLVLLTSPFMLLHGAFKMIGAFCNNIGILFTASAVLCKKLIWKSKKRNIGKVIFIFQNEISGDKFTSKLLATGPIQI